MKSLKLFLVLFIIVVTATNIYAQEINAERYKNRKNPVFELYKQNNVPFENKDIKSTKDDYFTFLGQWDMPDNQYGINRCVSKGNFVYGYAYWEGGFYSVDGENSEAPVTADHLNINSNSMTIWVETKENFIYVSGLNTAVSVVDVSDPANMIEIATYNPPNLHGGEVLGSYLSGNHLFLVDWEGFHIYEIQENGELNYITHFFANTMAVPLCITTQGDYAYLGFDANDGGSLMTVDISNPNNPQEVDYLSIPDNAMSIIANGDYLYVGDGNGYIVTLDISDPAAPQIDGLELLFEWTNISALRIINNTLFATNGHCFAFLMEGDDLIQVGEYIPDNDEYYVCDVAQRDDNTLFVAKAGYGIAIVTYNYSTQIDNNSKNTYNCFNYPNPFIDNTTITFENPNNGKVNLSIYNSVGQEVFTVIDEVLPAGTYNKEINTDRLKSGIYFYNLTTTEGIISKKMIKVK
jgi:hypothetical protein